MPGYNPRPALEAGGTIRPYRFVKMDSTDNKGLEADANEEAIGICRGTTKAFDSANHAESGDVIEIQMGDVMSVEIATTVSVGNGLKSDANGLGTPVATTGTTNQYRNCIALEGGAANDIIKVVWDPKIIQPQPT